METPSFKEDHISQISALQMLVNLLKPNMHSKVAHFTVQNKIYSA